MSVAESKARQLTLDVLTVGARRSVAFDPFAFTLTGRPPALSGVNYGCVAILERRCACGVGV